jgi:hypothetical protein
MMLFKKVRCNLHEGDVTSHTYGNSRSAAADTRLVDVNACEKFAYRKHMAYVVVIFLTSVARQRSRPAAAGQ